MKELIAIQQELKAPKGQYNSFGKYRYRSCEDILEAVKPLLAKHGCMLTISDDICELGTTYTLHTENKDSRGNIKNSDFSGTRVYVVATATLTNAEGVSISTKAYAREDITKAGMDDAQITGSASSYARKYALNGLFCIDDTKDADAEQHKQTTAQNTASKPEPPELTQEEQDDFELAKADIRNATTLEAITDIMLARKGVAYYSELRKIAAEKSKEL